MNAGSLRDHWKSFRHMAGSSMIRVLSRFSRINEQPVFVLGNQKSGTTVIASLLAKYAGLTSTIDFHYPTATLLLKVHAEELTIEEFVQRHAFYFSRDLVKEPGLTFLFHPLVDLFPQAQFVMVLRDPRDNLRSLLNRLKIPGHLEEIRPIDFRRLNIIWQEIIQGRGLRTDGYNYIEDLSMRWNFAADTYLQNADKMCLVRYEDFCTDKSRTIAHLAQELGQPQQYDISAKVDVQYQIRGNREISWEDFFGMENLSKIEKNCGPYMEQFGYAVSTEKSGFKSRMI